MLFRGFWNILEALTLALGLLPPLASTSLHPHSSMRLSSALPAKNSTQNNVFSQYNIISILLANNSLFPIADQPLSKFAWPTANQSDHFQIQETNQSLPGSTTSAILPSKTTSASANGRIFSMSSSSL